MNKLLQKYCFDLFEKKSNTHKKPRDKIILPSARRSCLLFFNVPIIKEISVLIDMINSGIAGIDFKILTSIIQLNILIQLNWLSVYVISIVLSYSPPNGTYNRLSINSQHKNQSR